MKTYIAYIETGIIGSRCDEEFDVPDDATEEEIEETARGIAFDMGGWGYYAKEAET